MLQRGWDLKTLCQVKKPDTKGHTLWLHFYETDSTGKSLESKRRGVMATGSYGHVLERLKCSGISEIHAQLREHTEKKLN